MKSLKAILDAVRGYFGWGTLSETRLSPAHGWLLRDSSGPRAGVPAVAKTDTK
jgi:hypothetical protein